MLQNIFKSLGNRSSTRIDGGKARELVASGAALIDVRTPAEYSAGHIEGAKNIPLAELAVRYSELGSLSDPIVLYCRSGARSRTAQGHLSKLGFEQVYDLGSINPW